MILLATTHLVPALLSLPSQKTHQTSITSQLSPLTAKTNWQLRKSIKSPLFPRRRESAFSLPSQLSYSYLRWRLTVLNLCQRNLSKKIAWLNICRQSCQNSANNLSMAFLTTRSSKRQSCASSGKRREFASMATPAPSLTAIMSFRRKHTLQASTACQSAQTLRKDAACVAAAAHSCIQLLTIQTLISSALASRIC